MELHPWFHLEFIPVYNLLAGIGMLSGIFLFQFQAKRNGLKEMEAENWIILVSISAVLGFLGGNLWSSLFYPELEGANLSERLMYAGFSYLPGFIVFLCSIYLISIFIKINTNYLLNLTLPSIALTHAMGRAGCALAGCCFGKELESFSGIRFPAREIEILYALAILYLFQSQVVRNRLLLYISSYSLLRFFLEFARGDNRGQFLTNFLSPSQEICLFLLLASLLYYFIMPKTHLPKKSKKDFLFRKPQQNKLNMFFLSKKRITKKNNKVSKNICRNILNFYSWTHVIQKSFSSHRMIPFDTKNSIRKRK